MSLSFKALLGLLSTDSDRDDPPPRFQRAAPRPPRKQGLRFLPAGAGMRANLAQNPNLLPFSRRGDAFDPNNRPR